MSLGKLPVFKNLVSNSHGKRRFKSELTPDMISPPLGDFRHTMHVGRGGDVFGDTSFLSDHGGEKARESAKSNLLVRALRNVRKSPMRSQNSSREMSPPPAVSPIIKNAVSLPHLLETKNGSVERLNFKSVVSSPGVMDGSYGLESGFCTLPRWSRLDKPKDNSALADLEKPMDDTDSADFELPRTDSLLSFSLDLGPSLMSEVLAVMSSGGALPKETAHSPGNAGRPVKFNLEGSFGQADLQGVQRNGHQEWPGEAGRPGESRDFSGGSSFVELKRTDLSKEMDGLRGMQTLTTERQVLRHFGGSINYPDSSHKRGVIGEYQSVSQQPSPPRETIGISGQDGAPQAANASLVQRILSRHFVAVPPTAPSRESRLRAGAPAVDGADGGGRRTQPLPSGQRAPADGDDGEEAGVPRRGEGYDRERQPAVAEGTGFSPLKTEAFAFADEDEEIRV
ncbi:cdc42 effector protein 4-like [Heptranchias perlo]|uniref:cdc42 effector protein 4-like n=1 Tax=Heptranchias perlo TaxID=212740 RepID=UPI0035597701